MLTFCYDLAFFDFKNKNPRFLDGDIKIQNMRILIA